jgi:hypothetical protein
VAAPVLAAVISAGDICQIVGSPPQDAPAAGRYDGTKGPIAAKLFS